MKFFLLLFLTVLFIGCKKKNTSIETGTFELYLTDSPGLYDNLYVDIQEVEVLIQGIGWEKLDLQIVAPIDLLAFNNGTDVLLAKRNIQIGSIIKIKLTLGENNFVVKNGITHTLILPSNVQSGIEITLNSPIENNLTSKDWIDFDAGKSVKELPDGTFKLIPVIKTYKESNNGRIKGFVLPAESFPHIEAIKGSDTTIAIPEDNGFFQFSGLQGAYKLRFVPSVGTFNTIETTPINVTGNEVIDYGSVVL